MLTSETKRRLDASRDLLVGNRRQPRTHSGKIQRILARGWGHRNEPLNEVDK